MVAEPIVQSADTDGQGPRRRRRRPALSCVECRIRKVKCNREKPCEPCKKIRSETCTYRPERASIRSRGDTSLEAMGAYSSGENRHGQDHGASNEFDLLINRYIAPGLFGEHGCPKLQPLPSNNPSVDISPPLNLEGAAVIKNLLERISILEGKRTSTTRGDEGDRITASPGTDASITGQFVKSKFFGQSHWMNAIEPYDALGDTNTTINHQTNRKEINKSTALYATVAEIKRMARIIKASRMLQPSLSPELQESIPSREICNVLVECYLRTFESVFRVLHIPTFRREYSNYWTLTIPVRPSVLLKILLVCAIGVTFYTGHDQAQLRKSCAKWIQAASNWLSAPHAKSRLNMAGLQIQILELLARQICNFDGDHIWIPAGSLLRTAMHLGLHRDPSHFGKMSIFHAEMRRRLWATVLEITAQSSLDMGMPPMISVNDCDTEPPTNVNDEDIGEESDALLEKKPSNTFTGCSIQIALTQSLPVRLEIIRLINNLRFDLSYKDVLRLGAQLTRICRENASFLRATLVSNGNISPFQIKMFDSLVRRFVLCLHRPYFAKAIEGPQYHYSRKVCLDTSLAICAPATELRSGEEDDWTRMTHRCVGFFKSFFLYAVSTVYYELNSQIKERKEDSSFATPLVPMSTSPSSGSLLLPAHFQALRGVLESARNMAIARIRSGETNAKGVTFLSCALARVDALVLGTDAELAVLEAAKTSVREMRDIMTQVYCEEHGEDINLNLPDAPFAGKDHGRGDGADDVTGFDSHISSDQSVHTGGEMPALDRDTIRLGMCDGYLGALNTPVDLDLNAYLGGQSLETEWGYHFARSPEWFFDLNGWVASGDCGTGLSGISTERVR